MLDDNGVAEYVNEDTSDTSIAIERSTWRSIFCCCCQKRKKLRDRLSKGYNSGEIDHIVEKLVVKRVPMALFAATNYEQRINDNGVAKEKSGIEYPVMPEVRSTLYFSNDKASPNVSGIPSNKSLRFQNDQDILDEDVVKPGPSSYAKKRSSPFESSRFTTEYMNRWSALHPDLKENERAPKDPETLNAAETKRRLAEIISEAAASQKLPRVKNSKNAYSTGFNSSKETSAVPSDKEISTLHKHANKTTLSNERNTSAATSSRRRKKDFDERKYRSRKVVAHNTSEFQSFVENQRSNYSRTVETNEHDSATNVTSRATDEVRNAIINGTTLRWKVIIDHRPPTPSETESTSDLPAESSLPMLDDIFGNSPANQNCNSVVQAKVPDKTIYTADKDVSYKRS